MYLYGCVCSGGVVCSVGQPLPIIADLDTQTETHNYTNVAFALESAHGRSASGRSATNTASKQFARYTHTHTLTMTIALSLTATLPTHRAGDVTRKISAPPLNRCVYNTTFTYII